MARREPSVPPLRGGSIKNIASKVSVFTLDTLDDLKAKNIASVSDGDRAVITGYDSVGDGRSMEFYYSEDSSETADDINYVDPDSGSGQWVRAYIDQPPIESGDAGKILRIKDDESGRENFEPDSDWIENKYSEGLAVKRTQAVKNIDPASITITSPSSSNPIPVGNDGETAYGILNDTTIYRSTDGGDTWDEIQDIGGSSVNLIYKLSDGEILVNKGEELFKSSGWDSDPANATFSSVLSHHDPSIASSIGGFPPFSIDIQGDKVVVTEYNGKDASNDHYMYLSTDNADTFSTVADLQSIMNDNSLPNSSAHFHGCAIDPWEDDRLWFVNGDSGSSGMFYSDDDGTTWVQVSNQLSGNNDSNIVKYTTVKAMEGGMIFGTDSLPTGVVGLRRDSSATLEYLYTFRQGAADGLDYAWQSQLVDGVMYIVFSVSPLQDYMRPSRIVAITPDLNVQMIWEDGDGDINNPRHLNTLFVTDDSIYSKIEDNDNVFKADKPERGYYDDPQLKDTGNVLGGDSQNDTSRIAIGATAKATHSDGIAIGRKAVSGEESVVIANESNAENAESTIIGFTAGKGSQNKISAFGWWAGRGSTGNRSTVFGRLSGHDNIGEKLSALGDSSGRFNEGDSVVAFAALSAYRNTGNNVIAVGEEAARSNSASDSVFMGVLAGENNSGIRVTNIGHWAGRDNEGDRLLAGGYLSGYNNTGDNCVLLGYQAGNGNSQHNAFILKQLAASSTPLLEGDFEHGGLALGAPSNTNKLGDSRIGANRFTFYLDEANNELTVRVKYADGTTIKEGTIALA